MPAPHKPSSGVAFLSVPESLGSAMAQFTFREINLGWYMKSKLYEGKVKAGRQEATAVEFWCWSDVGAIPQKDLLMEFGL